MMKLVCQLPSVSTGVQMPKYIQCCLSHIYKYQPNYFNQLFSQKIQFYQNEFGVVRGGGEEYFSQVTFFLNPALPGLLPIQFEDD